MSTCKEKRTCRHCDEANAQITRCTNPMRASVDKWSGHQLLHITSDTEACGLYRESSKYVGLTPLLREIQITKDICLATFGNGSYLISSPYDYIDPKEAIEETRFPRIEYIEDQFFSSWHKRPPSTLKSVSAVSNVLIA